MEEGVQPSSLPALPTQATTTQWQTFDPFLLLHKAITSSEAV
jgi:hypothetical protein